MDCTKIHNILKDSYKDRIVLDRIVLDRIALDRIVLDRIVFKTG
jgi:hypothetical protein